MIDLRSDNVSGVCPEILEELLRAASDTAPAYGTDAATEALNDRFGDLFGTPVEVFPVATGTIANALALAQVVPPWGAVYCHRLAHIHTSECGAPEHASGGAKLISLEGSDARFSADTLAAGLRAALGGIAGRTHTPPAAVSLSQASERGTLYRPADIAAIAEVCRSSGLILHVDGARFANAVARLGCHPAEITWRAGVDVLSFGATKNGAMIADAIVFFRPGLAESFRFRQKRAGHLISKMRYLSVQLERYVRDDLWLQNARHANAMADRVATGLSAVDGVRLVHPVEANEIFVELPTALAAGLRHQGFGFSHPEPDMPELVRFVTSFNTRQELVTQLIEAAVALATCRSTLAETKGEPT